MTTAAREFTGRHLLYILVGFFSVVIGVNLLMAHFAKSSWTGLVVENGYVASQEFNKELEKAREQKALGWLPEFIYDSGRGIIEVKVLDKTGTPLPVKAAWVSLVRPSDSRLDANLTMTPDGLGHFLSEKKLEIGKWQARLQLEDATGHTMRQEYSFVVR